MADSTKMLVAGKT